MAKRRTIPKAPREQLLCRYHNWQMLLLKKGHKQILIVRWSLS